MPDGPRPDGPRYEDDFFAWTRHQAAVLRSLAVADNRFDREHLAEEIEDLGRSERDALRSQIRRIIEHLIKLAHAPADKMSPSLRRDAQEVLDRLYADGRKRAAAALRRHGEHAAAEALRRFHPIRLTTSAATTGIPRALERSHEQHNHAP